MSCAAGPGLGLALESASFPETPPCAHPTPPSAVVVAVKEGTRKGEENRTKKEWLSDSGCFRL